MFLARIQFMAIFSTISAVDWKLEIVIVVIIGVLLIILSIKVSQFGTTRIVIIVVSLECILVVFSVHFTLSCLFVLQWSFETIFYRSKFEFLIS